MSKLKSPLAVSSEHQAYLQARKYYQRKVVASQVFLLLSFLVVWEIAGRLGWIDPFIMSQPSRIIETVKNLHAQGSLYYHTGITVFETIIGFVSGTIIGTIIAFILWWSDFLSRVFDPYLVILNSLPKPALGPILIVWIGSGPGAIIAMALLISLIVTILNVYSGFAQVDSEKIRLLKTFGANKLQIFEKAIFPASVPTIISALKINVGLSWVGVIVGEFLVSKAGLGYLIVYGGQVFRLDLVMTSVIILAIASAIMYRIVVLLEKALLKWR